MSEFGDSGRGGGPGRVIGGGRYTLDERIASGGMGEVWRGTDTSLGRTVAIKLLREHIADDTSFRSRFATEAQHAASLHDQHIATVFDYGDDIDASSGRHSTYLVMEFVDGRPLSELITRPVAPDQAALLVAQAAEGLAVAHDAGIVHRDVKPANFLVTPSGRVKVTDFGIARARGAASITDTGTILGTPHYVAPEVVEGHEATPASDLYSLGVVLYETLTGVKPFDGETPIAIALAHLRDDPKPLPASVPPRLRSIVESMMARDPALRPPDTHSLVAALRQFAAQPDERQTDATPAPPPGTATRVMPAPAAAPAPGEPAPTRARRRGWLPVAAAVLAVLLIVGIAYAATRDDDSPSDHTASTRDTTPAGASDTTPADQSDPTTPTTSTEETTSTSEPAETSETADTTSLDPTAYIGRPVKDVEKELRDLGLHPVRGDEVTGGEKDTVADLSPTGEVPVGEEIVLTVFTGEDENGGPGPGDEGPGDEGPGDKAPGRDGNGHGHGPKPKES